MRKLLLVLGLNILILWILLLLVLFTPLGTFVVNNGKVFFEEYITYEKFEGILAGKSKISSLLIRSETVDIAIEHVDLNWSPARLLKKSLQIGDIVLEGVRFNFKGGEKENVVHEPENTIILPEIILPFSMIIGKLSVDNIVLANSFEELWKINRVELTCQSDGRKYEIKNFLFDSQEADLNLQGTLTTEADWPVDISGQWQLDFETYNRMGGDIHLKGKIEDLNVELSANRPVRLQVSGSIKDILNEMNWDGVIVSGEGSLQEINKIWPEIPIWDLTANMNGDLESYTGMVHGSMNYMNIQDLKLDIELDGDADGIVFPHIHGVYKDSSADVQGEIGWKDFFFWKGEGTAEGFAIDDYTDFFSGRLDGKVLSQGKIGYEDDDVLHCFINVPMYSGTLNGYPVRGKGRVVFDDKRFEVDNFAMYSGESTLEVDGIVEDYIDFSFHIDSPDISHFIDKSKGRLIASGTVKGETMAPNISYEIEGSNLEYDQQTIKRIRGKGVLDFADNGQLQANIEAAGIVVEELIITEALFTATGTTEKHQALLQFKSNVLSGNIKSEGSFTDERWSAKTRKILFDVPEYGIWESSQQALMTLDSAGNFEVKDAGLKNGYGEVQGSFKINSEGVWTANCRSEAFNLGYFKKIFPIEYQYEGKTTFNAVALGSREGLEDFDLDLSLDDVQVNFILEEGGEEQTVVWESNVLNASLNQQQLNVNVYSSFDGGSYLMGSLVGENLDTPENSFDKKISGSISLEIQDLSSLSWLTFGQVQPAGLLIGEFNLDGTLLKPMVNGTLGLEQSSFFIPAAGIRLEKNDIQFEVRPDRLEYTFTSHSGEGSIAGEGIVYYGSIDDLHGSVSAKGSAFEIVNLPEYNIVISPDVQLMLNSKTGKLSGEVVVENTVISPEELNSVLLESKDVVYVDSIEEGKKKYWPLVTDLDIVMGDNVRVDSFGLKSFLDGQIKVTGDPGEQLAAFGELWLRDGTFSIYARTLDIERGQVFFTGGLIENPILDVRAQKSVNHQQAGSQGSWTVGVDVRGPIDDLQYELFSTPALKQADILAYLIVGHSASDSDSNEEGLLKTAANAFGLGSTADFMQRIGAILPVDEMHMEGGSSTEDASIVIGKRLTDDIFLGYDYNFFKSTSEFIFRYELGRGFYIESRSSADANSGDLFYTFEK